MLRHTERSRVVTSYKYVTLDILLKFDSLDKMKMTSSESKDNLGRSGKGFITSLGLNTKVTPHKYKNAIYAIVNVSKKNFSKIIREFGKLPYESFEKKRPKLTVTFTQKDRLRSV